MERAVTISTTTLAAYVGEDVIVRYDPRDMAELRVYFGETFLCRAINPELAGETVALKDIIRARNQRRRQLSSTLAERQATVEARSLPALPCRRIMYPQVQASAKRGMDPAGLDPDPFPHGCQRAVDRHVRKRKRSDRRCAGCVAG